LPEVPGEEQAVRPPGAERRKEPQFGDADVLRLVDNGKIEAPLAGRGDMRSDPAE
jgi:hypothetical protein